MQAMIAMYAWISTPFCFVLESRFSHEVITQEADLLPCMIYVDLNPIRANMAQTPEESDFTVAKDRIDDLRIRLQQAGTGN